MPTIDLDQIATFREAAKEKGCRINTLRRAAKRGKLTVVKAIGVQYLMRDAKYDEWAVQETGGRTHESYRGKKRTK